ncbi:hypothetical protein Mp_1g16310 [Marchantia polymorpha subsp. ruderalis]|uniref:MaoC-like domain-containing protein n=2 Tax=Marchantia polymorpha TaxID=3197 RepID=A0AAF6AQS5_MARPO|nr:hypothetical protein MARPO_0033s0029 [Marchantia polymorpha]BBM98795.1 hypothetical protein Mp_1g16310 [Marchantia polymorpha subsp. ruderalis]|eukprot:PTQ41608.1 hypothetical protein MARPO_0033s0029 [Marchantia polymorpha]
MTKIRKIQPDLVFSNGYPESTFECAESDVALYDVGKASATPLPISTINAVLEDQTHQSHVHSYRVSTDYWPHAFRQGNLHARTHARTHTHTHTHTHTERAAHAGFEQPVFQGLCTLRFAVRAVVRICCYCDCSRMQSIHGRRLAPTYPGQKLATEMWSDDSHNVVMFVCKSQRSECNVLICHFDLFSFSMSIAPTTSAANHV